MVGAAWLPVHKANIVSVLIDHFSWGFLAAYLTEYTVRVGDISGADSGAQGSTC
jgi:hypothetical protein